MRTISVSIIIPTCRRTADLTRCLERLVPQLPADGSCELLVSDDGDVEETKRTLAATFPLVRWSQGPQRGPAANRNHGVSATSGDWLIFADDDVLPTGDFLAAYLEAIADASDVDVALEGATVREQQPTSLLWEAPHNPDGGMLISCNFAISRRLYEHAGRFDERFPVAAFEDTEFAARLLAKGFKIRFLPRAKLLHPLRATPPARRLAARWEGRVIYAFEQGASAFRILWNLPWHVFRVVPSRFEGQRWSLANAKAAGIFLREWLWVLWLTPGWVGKWSGMSRSEFWKTHVERHGPVPKFGF